MIAKAKVIQHGHNAINYAVNKEHAKIIKLNFLPQGITPDAMWQRMMLHQKLHEHQYNGHRKLKNNMIRIEVSPRKEETEDWDISDWEQLAKDFIQAFDAIDLSNKAKRDPAKSTALTNSQYIVALHIDSKSGIPHLHIDANRIDMEGNVNDAHFIYERAIMTAQIINQKRGWHQADHFSMKNKNKIAADCYSVLKSMPRFDIDDYFERLSSKGYEILQQRDRHNQIRGYSIKMGNSIYKSSEIGNGRKYMPSKLANTWRSIHPTTDSKMADKVLHTSSTKEDNSKSNTLFGSSSTETATSGNRESHREVSSPNCKYIFYTDKGTREALISSDISDKIRYEIESAQPPTRVDAETIDRIQHVAVALFVGYIDAALTMSESYGAGGSVSSNWGKDNEDDYLWAQKCARKAIWLCMPQLKRGRGR